MSCSVAFRSRRSRRVPRSLAQALLCGLVTLLFGGSIHAATNQDFEGAGDPYVLSRYGALPAAAIIANGPTGNFLRLAGSNNQLNTISLDRTDKGAFCTFTVDADFRIVSNLTPGVGLGIVLLDTSNYAETGGANFDPPEPSLAGSVGIGFDVFSDAGEINNNHVSLYFDGVKLLDADASAIVDLDATTPNFIHARIVIDATLAGGNVLVELTAPGGSPTTLINQAVPGLRPYEGRLAIGGKTTTIHADHEIDNLSVSYAGCPSEIGSWSGILSWPIVAIHASLMPTGDILMWDRDDALPVPPKLFDPDTEIVTSVPDPVLDLFCSGHSMLSDGRLFVTGGHDLFDSWGLPDAHIYDPVANSWHHVAAPMNAGRWYPTNLTLPDGDVLVIAGSISPGVQNPLPQVFETETETWRDLTGASKEVTPYPMMLQAPDGRVAMVGPAVKTEFLDTSGSGSWTTIGNRLAPVRNVGSAAAYDHGKILVLGGGSPALASAEIIDLNVPSPSWSLVSPMAYKRRHLTSLILADGSVLASGGTEAGGFNDAIGSVFTPEIWDPQTEEFTRVAGHQVPRLYHSFSLLLPDARVLVGGGGHPPGGLPDFDHFDAEIYSPAYLFKGPRPTITSAPSLVTYGAVAYVATPDAASISAVHFIRLSSTTHGFNQNQRIHRASFQATAGALLVDTPPTSIHAPPGHYLLFLLNNQGVPSVAEFVQILDPTQVPALPTAVLWGLTAVLGIGASAWAQRKR